ncbi:3-deoxy-D-manno-octulosonic acid transferase [Synergistales bacterium]|nr:3-deoxy-D-manno-octulosonic acid transferase [Synergistales bacterium]
MSGCDDPFSSAGYRVGLSFYMAGISAFFALGGLSRLQKKYHAGIDERMGKIGKDVPQNAVWIHSVSVGEVQSAMPLIDKVKEHRPDLPRILSTVTATGREMAQKLAAQKVDKMIYNPWDTPKFVKKALDTLKPKAYIAMETERWPTMLSELRSRGIPAFLANGRLSAQSAKKLRGQRVFWRGVLSCFERILVRFEDDKKEFLSLGVSDKKIIVTGDCKIDAILGRRDEALLKAPALKRALIGDSDNPLFLAGSTHEGEDEIVLGAFAEVKTTCPDARLIVVPRHPERAPSVADLSEAHEARYKTALFSDIKPEWDVLVVDKIGVLFELYALVDAAFVGGSLGRHGGQNPTEPALFGIQTTHGPDMHNFPDVTRMDSLAASVVTRNASELAQSWILALTRPEKLRARLACEKYFSSIGGAAKRTFDVIKEYI